MITSGRPPRNNMNPKSTESWLGLLDLALRNANVFYSLLLLALTLDIALFVSGQSILDLRWSALSEAISPGAAVLCPLAVLLLILHSSCWVRRYLASKEFVLGRMDDFFRWALETPDIPPQPPCRYSVSLREAERHASKTANEELAQKVKESRSLLAENQNLALRGARLSLVCLILIGIEVLLPNGTFAASGDYRIALWACVAFVAAVPLIGLRRSHIEGDGRIECPELAWTLNLAWYASQGREPPGLAYRAVVMKRLQQVARTPDL